MAGNTAELMYGDVSTVQNILYDTGLDEGELRAALCNAFRMIDCLQAQVAKLAKQDNRTMQDDS